MTGTDAIMATPAHTPGPWTVEPCTSSWGTYRIVEAEKDIQELDDLNSDLVPQQEERDLANARLIAAAPDLLEALDYLLQQTVDQDLQYGWGLSEGEEDALAKALAAIAKATIIHPPTKERTMP
jgi:hypothetical protein